MTSIRVSLYFNVDDVDELDGASRAWLRYQGYDETMPERPPGEDFEAVVLDVVRNEALDHSDHPLASYARLLMSTVEVVP
jgi:hypothetical protein